MKKLLYLLLFCLPFFADAQTLPTDSVLYPGSSPFTPTGWRRVGTNVNNYRWQYYDTTLGKWIDLITLANFNNYIGVNTQAALDAKQDTAVVSTIGQLIAYTGNAKTVHVADTLRGGDFDYAASVTQFDNGVRIQATGRGSGAWVRNTTNAHGVHINWFGAVPYPTSYYSMGMVDSKQAVQDAIDFNRNSNTKILADYGTYMMSDSVVLGEGTVVEGLSTLFPRQYFGDCSIFTDYTNMSAFRFYNNTSGFVTTLAVVPYRSQGIRFYHIGIFGSGKENGQTGLKLRQTANSTFAVKTTGLVTTEDCYFADWKIGADGSNSADSWYIERSHFNDLKIGFIGGQGQTFFTNSDLFKIDSIGGILNSSSEPDLILGGEIETRYANIAAFVVNGKAQFIGTQFITNKKSIIFKSTSLASVVSGNHFHSGSDDYITLESGAKDIQIIGNTFQNDYATNAGYNYACVLEPLNATMRNIYSDGARPQIVGNTFIKENAGYLGNPVEINNSTLTASNNKFQGFTYTNEQQFVLTGTNTISGGYDLGARTVVGDLTVSGATFAPSIRSKSGTAFSFGSTGANSIFASLNGSNVWQWTSANTYQPVLDNGYNLGGTSNRIATGYFTNIQLGLTGILKGNGAGSNVSVAVSGTDYPAVSTTPVISSGTAAPVSTPAKVGNMYVDTSAKKIYVATGTASSADWTILN